MEHRHHFRTDVPYEARCVMRLPDDEELLGLRVLDAWCRRGKGAFLIADRVGSLGAVVGVDPRVENVAAAREAAMRSRTDAWPREVRFVCAEPAGMLSAGVEAASADLVVANAALNLAPSVLVALRAFARVLAPGGRLWLDALVRADAEVPAPAAEPAFERAPTWPSLMRMLTDAGFAPATLDDREPAAPGYERGIVCARI